MNMTWQSNILGPMSSVKSTDVKIWYTRWVIKHPFNIYPIQNISHVYTLNIIVSQYNGLN